MQNIIQKIELIDWRKIKPLQPSDIKIVDNKQQLKDSMQKHGFAMPFFVWENKGSIYAIDGHTRIEVLTEIDNAPKLLPAVFIDAKTKKKAIEILLEVYNGKTNKLNSEVLFEWLDEIKISELNVDALNIQYTEIDETEFLDEQGERLEGREDDIQIVVRFLNENDKANFIQSLDAEPGRGMERETATVFYHPRQPEKRKLKGQIEL